MRTRIARQVPDRIRRAWVKGLCASGAAIALGLDPTIAFGAGQRLAEGVNKVSGNLYINGKLAIPGDSVPLGATVTTDSASEAVVVVGGHAFLVHEKTEVVMPGAQIANDVMTLVAGKLLSVFDEGPKTLNTPFASIGIRGTGIYMDADATRLYVCLCYGAADFVAPDGRLLERLTTEHHDSPRYIHPPGGAKTIEPAPVFDHTDDELKMLEWAVGRDVPFGNGAGDGGQGRY